ISDGASRGVQAGTEDLKNSDKRVDCFVLSDDFRAKGCLEILNLRAAFRGIQYSGLNAHCALPKRPRSSAELFSKSVLAFRGSVSVVGSDLVLAHDVGPYCASKGSR